MSTKAILSVGLNQNWANDKDRCDAVSWLKAESPVSKDAQRALTHIHELEGLLDVEKYATLSRMAGKMRDVKSKMPLVQAHFLQTAINMVMDELETIDVDSQAATSIMEMIHAAVLGAAELIRNPDDYQAVVNYAKAILDGES